MIPIDIERLLDGTVVESNRIEFKRDWNPEKVLHTICAFANDLSNIGGGYIVIGVTETEGLPLEYTGISESEYKALEADLFNKCNLITPRYVPEAALVRYRGVHLALIWAPCGESRPYKCPMSLGKLKKNEHPENAYYVRQLSNTVRANREEETLLIRRSMNMPFDNMINMDAQVRALRRGLVEDYLSRTGSAVDPDGDTLDLFRSLRIVRGPPEAPRPVNIGLMMFTDRPEDYFDKARIELVHMPSDDGEGMEESVYDGPVDDQLRKVLSDIRSRFIRERVEKVPYQAEAIRFYNYPYEAVEETVVNAVYHKSYEIPEAVKIVVRRDRIEVFNRPGPDKSITDERIARFDLRFDCYLNGRLGDFLKSLKLAEGRNTGIPKVLRSLEENGSDPPVYETDSERRYMRVVIPIHRGFLRGTGDDEPKGKYRSPSETKALILESLRVNGCQRSKELAASIGYSGVNNTFRRCLAELMEEGEVEYLYPDSPRDSRQRICLPSRRP